MTQQEIQQPITPPMQKPVEHVSPVPEIAQTPEPIKLSPPHKLPNKKLWTIIAIMFGSLLLFVIGVLLFQPRAYFWVMQQVGEAEKFTTDTRVEVERKFTPQAEAAAAGAAAEQDTISIQYKASHVAPDTWAYTSDLSSSNPAFGGGTFEARLFGKDAFQRENTASQFTAYTFPEADYNSTIKVIRASSAFVPGFLDYALNTRFVFAGGGQPFWMLHYRYELDVAKIEKDIPDWFTKESFPFSSDASIADQSVTTIVDLWVNPFTGKVQKEEWRIVKKGNDPASGTIDLHILLTRTISYPTSLTIDKPQVTS